MLFQNDLIRECCNMAGTGKKKLSFARIINGVLLAMLGLIMFYPFWYVVCYALSSYENIIRVNLPVIPMGFTWKNVSFILATADFVHIYGNTIFVVVTGTVLSLIITLLYAYSLSRKVHGHRVFNYFAFFTLIFGGGMVPTFMVVRATGLLNNLWALIIPRLVDPFNIFLLRNFLESIPTELDESAHIDGAGTLKTMFRIVLPLALPGIATVALFYMVGYWNQFFEAVLYTSNRPQWTLQVMLKELLVSSDTDAVGSGSGDSFGAALSTSVKMASVLVTIVPVMCVYPFLQKYFVTGAIAGAVKG